ncbi:MAG: hypothetical protein ACYCPA_12485 [Acidithiobacillus sp.]
MGTFEGYLLGQALAGSQIPDYDAAPAWKARAGREEARAERAEDQVEKLSAALQKEHKRFLVERKDRMEYQRGWAVRGKILQDRFGFTRDDIKAESPEIVKKYKDEFIADEENENRINDEQCGF